MGKKSSDPVNYSAAITAMAQQSAQAQMYSADRQYQLGMAQIGSQMIQAEGMFQLGQAQIDANLTLGRERLETRLEIARLNYLQAMTTEENRHLERLGEQDLRRYEIDQEYQNSNQVETAGFFA